MGEEVYYAPDTLADSEFEIPSYPDSSTTDGGVSLTTDEANANYLTWKVWKKNSNGYWITPTTPTTRTIKLKGANGYNNAVQALNAYCKKYYSDSANGVYARSINIEDLEGAMTTAGQTAKAGYSGYGTTTTPTNNSTYPLSYNNEIDGGGSKGLSESPTYPYDVWSGTATSTSGKTGGYKSTCYSFNNSDIINATNPYYDATTRNLMFSITGYGNGYWIASHCVSAFSSTAYFSVRYVHTTGILDGAAMYTSNGENGKWECALKPVVYVSKYQIQKYVKNIKVGDVVNYKPTTLTDSEFKIPSYPSSWSDDGRVALVTDEANANYLTWKVWKKNYDGYWITPTTPTTRKIQLVGANGYNNAVQALNAYCRKYYSDSANGVYARSIKIEDLEEAMTPAGRTAKAESGYGTTITPTNNLTYPLAYDNEIDGGGSKGLSESPIYPYDVWSGNAKSTSGKTGGYRHTYYAFNNSNIINATNPYYDATTRNLMFSSTGYGTGYWIASRCVDTYSDKVKFYVRYVTPDGGLHGYGMCYTDGDNNGNEFCLRPVVYISKSQIQKYIQTGN